MRKFSVIFLTLLYTCFSYGQDTQKTGNIWINPVDGMKFVWVPSGSFDAEIPYDSSGTQKYSKEIIGFSDGFWMGQTEVTIKQFQSFVESTGYITEVEKEDNQFTWKNPGFSQKKDHPVVFVSHQDAKAYAEWAEVDLPLETEWVYACQGGVFSKFYWGDDFDEHYVWYRGNSETGTKSVGKKLPNRWGLYDMVGNVWEFVQICDGIMGLRGGSWTRCNEARGRTGSVYDNIIYGTVRPRMMRCIHTIFQPDNPDDDRGFRCVKRIDTRFTKVN